MKLLLFFILIFSIGCAKKEAQTKLTVSISAITGSALFPGGLVVAGKSNTGKSFVRKVPANDILELNLPNGSWSFSAIGWDGPAIFEGDSFCDLQSNITLEGFEVALSFATTKAKCTSPFFGGTQVADTTNGFFPLQFNSCIGLEKHLLEEGSQAAEPGGDCDGGHGPLPGEAVSFTIEIPDVMNLNGSPTNLGTSLLSSCQDGASSGQLNTSLRIPFGSSVFGLPFIIKSHSSAGCSGTINTYVYKDGLSQPADLSRGGATPDPGGAPARIGLYLHEDMCVGNQLTNSPFAAGSAVMGFLVCTPAQFVQIATDNSTLHTATYILGADIDLTSATPQGGEAYIEDYPFGGSLIGNGFNIINGDRAIFDVIDGAAAPNDRVIIGDFNINNFTISTAGGAAQNIGILANEINFTVSGEFEIEKIDITNSSLTVANTSHTGGIGALAGFINSSTSPIAIRDNLSFATISSTTGSGGQAIGGLVGRTAGQEIRFDKNSIGIHPNDLSNLTNRVSITGSSDIGGLIGYADQVSIGHRNLVFADITGETRVGGLIGKAYPSAGMIQIQDTMSDIVFTPSTTASMIGGAIGSVIENSPVHLEGITSNLKINPVPITINNIGGIIGENNVTNGSSGIQIRNSKSKYNVTANGEAYGGFIGKLSAPTIGTENIISSVSSGSFNSNTASAVNQKRGGIAGNANNLMAKFIIVQQVTISGHTQLGGAFGYTFNDTTLREADITATILSQKATNTELYIGGIVGSHVVSSGIDKLQNIKLNADISLTSTSNNCATTSKCGVFVGTNVNNTANGMNGIVWEVNLTEDIAGTPTSIVSPPICGNSSNNCTALTHYSNAEEGFSSTSCVNLTTVSRPFIYKGSECHTLFESKWFDFGYNATDGYYLAGGSLEPFPISNPDVWNDIGDNALLMGKTFSLTDNIDFASASYAGPGNIIPMGSVANPFTGKIIPNGYTLSNIIHTGSGIFPLIENGAQIGLEHDPLKVDNMDLTCNISSCGFIGVARQGRLSININDSIVGQDPSRGNIGGIIGEIYDTNNSAMVYLRNSSFTGTVSGDTSVGGLVGSLNLASASLDIDESFVSLNLISGSSSVGGLLGSAIASSSLWITDSYVLIDPTNTHPGDDFVAATASGGIIGSNNTGSSVDNVFIDMSAADLNPNFRAITAGATNPAGSSYIVTGLNSFTAGGWTPTETVANYVDLIDTTAIVVDDQSGFTLDSNAKVRLYWEIFGFNHYD